MFTVQINRYAIFHARYCPYGNSRKARSKCKRLFVFTAPSIYEQRKFFLPIRLREVSVKLMCAAGKSFAQLKDVPKFKSKENVFDQKLVY